MPAESFPAAVNAYVRFGPAGWLIPHKDGYLSVRVHGSSCRKRARSGKGDSKKGRNTPLGSDIRAEL